MQCYPSSCFACLVVFVLFYYRLSCIVRWHSRFDEYIMKRITFFTSKSGLIFFLAGRICSCSCSSRVAASAASGRPLSHKSRWPGAGASSPVLTVMRRPLSLIESASVGYSCPPSDTHWLCDCLSACTRCAFIRPPLLLRLSH